ncbi:MAG TPA: LacI family DNA-binding transcriptional regulator [Stackebrandtia sp.]|uniref:LacI family DNA-binding transcriptional regulator n=1 Tax=Stackebrandtia sp. TaxID=2023065 RepID=UPI002D390A45|nr:LacI family DNA-binding transcriptional regulator [Stackebrandtia sp.]HZE40645.1 LacI family DNA-binding transcriptional regulator [Stackebrandtia sp.]
MAEPTRESHRPKPTSRDVAALAGVSVATVSYVLNGRRDRRVGDATRQRVLDAAASLNYAPNQSARDLRRRRTQRVCLVVGSIGVPTYDKLAEDLHAVADAAEYGVVTMVAGDADRARKAIESLRQGIADGALIATGDRVLAELSLESLAASAFPLVVLGNHVEASGFDVSRFPETAACERALRHLVDSGRRRIAFVGHRGDFDGTYRSERYGAYRSAVARHGLDADESLVVAGADDRVEGYRAVKALLALSAPPDAVFVASDRAAISAIWAARDAGLSVPRDLAVVGSGNLPDGLITNPPLTTVGPSRLDYSPAVRMLFSRIASGQQLPGRTITTDWTFIRRGSA